MKIIFLDFDGVVNSGRFIWSGDKKRKGRYGSDRYWAGMIDPKTIPLLNYVVQTTGAKVVVSSSWRLLNTKHDLQRYLNHHGFLGEVIDITPSNVLVNGKFGVRGDEIQTWLNSCSNPIESFVIIDDDSDMAHLTPKLVKTQFEHGLLEEHVEKIIQILNEV